LKANGFTPTLEGKEAVDGKECFKIKLTHATQPETIMYIDASDYTTYLMRVDVPQMGKMDQVFLDYRMEGGVYMPHKIEMRSQMPGSIIFEKVETNITLDDSLFKMPGK
jgi:hypothetical protein